ncbi:Procollagen C-endopeptidase enhancer 2, partial [Camelus dromedarius]
VPEGKVVVLNFRFIDLESDNLCRYDFVDVYNGHANGQRIGRFCGTFRPGALVWQDISLDDVHLKFRFLAHVADDLGHAVPNSRLHLMCRVRDVLDFYYVPVQDGSKFDELIARDQYCGGLLERPSGSFNTPNWPDRDYPAGVTCVWHIVAPKNQLIELMFEKFDVERDNYCRYDYVAVFNGGEVNDAERIGKYCGDSPPAQDEQVADEEAMAVVPVKLRRPIVSERNELLIQFLSDLSLTADGFIGHYKFRPKKLPTTTIPPVTTTFPATTSLKPTVALCQQKCRRSGTLESNYCSSNFVLAGTVITTIPRGGSLHATVSIINIYKEGNLAIQQAGKNMSAKVVVVCKQCPLLRRGGPLESERIGLQSQFLSLVEEDKVVERMNESKKHLKLLASQSDASSPALRWHRPAQPTKLSEAQDRYDDNGGPQRKCYAREKGNIYFLYDIQGLNYIIMGQVGEDGRGKILPNSFIMMFKTKNQKLLNALKNKQC